MSRCLTQLSMLKPKSESLILVLTFNLTIATNDCCLKSLNIERAPRNTDKRDSMYSLIVIEAR